MLEGLAILIALLQAGMWVRIEHRVTRLEDRLEAQEKERRERCPSDCPLLLKSSVKF
jgi:hypothetical protein